MRQAYTLWALGALSSPAAAWLKVARQESWSPAQETAIAAQDLEDQAAIGFSPRPTEAPRLGRMLMPRLDGYQLGPGTCGFVESDGQAYRCIASTAICSRSGSWEGCCEPNRSCSVMKTTCIDFEASQDGQCNLPNDFHTLCCGESSAPSCFTWIISSTGTDGGDDETFTALGCQPTGGTGVLLDYDPAWSRTHSFASTASPTTGGGSSTTTSQAATSTAPAKKNDTPVGAIAGGVVGGVAALALIGVVGFLFWRRNKKNKAASSTPAVAPSTTQSPPPQNMTQMNAAPGQNVMSPVSPGGTAYPESNAPTYTSGGYPPSNYDPRMSYAQGQYPPHQSYGYQSPNPYPPQQGFDQQQQGYNAGGYAPTSTASPPPHLSPSPGFKEGEQAPPAQGQNQPPPMELPTNNPVGHENNRAELG